MIGRLHNQQNGQTTAVRRYAALLHFSWTLIAVLAAFITVAHAADVGSRSDTLTNQSTSAASSHQITFTLSTGNTFATGESISVDFKEDDGAFSVAGTTTTAADLSVNDGTARTIYGVTVGAASCAGSVGTNDIAVGINDATGVVTLLACPSFTASAAAATVTVRYGTAAGGTNRVTNPSSAGTYVITLPNAAGDCVGSSSLCGIGIPITSNGAVGVTTSALSAPPPPPPPPPPPAISSITVTSITKNSATVSWNTSSASTSLVKYGLTASYGSTNSQGAYVTSRSVPLTSLTEATLYHYQVCSTDTYGNQTCSSDGTFSTIDETPPVISGKQVTGITGSAATLTWTTNENSTTVVDYGTAAGPPYALTASNTTPVTSHSLTLSGLSELTTYHYRVRSADPSGNESFTANATFTTLDTTPPVISGITVTGITATGSTVTWTTSEATTITVEYATNAQLTTPTTVTDNTPRTSHSTNLTGLAENTAYYYRVTTCDAAGNCTTSAIQSFRTPDVTPPAATGTVPFELTATTVKIGWTTNEPADSLVEYGLTPSYGSSQVDTALVTTHEILLTNLSPFTTYNFRIKTKDGAGNLTTTGNFTFKTLKPPAPVISAIAATFITQTSARIGWTTDTDSNSVVEYGLTPSYGQTATNATLVKSHLLLLSGLKKGATYNYRVRSTDAYAQETVSGNQTFTTLADNTPPANVTGFTAAAGDTQVVLQWTNPADADFQGVRVMRKANSFPTGPVDGAQVYEGGNTQVIDTGLTNGVTYYYAVFAYDDVPNYSSGTVGAATPVGTADTVAPGNVSAVNAAPGNGQVELQWTNPADVDLAGVRIVRKAGSCPTSMADGTIVFDGPGTSKIDAGLANGTPYCYAFYSFDAVPNYAAGVTATATPIAPPDRTAPGNVTNFSATAGDGVVQLVWTNPADPDFAGVRIMRKEGSQSAGPNDGTVVFDGVSDNRLDAGLANGITYFYTAYPYDPAANFASGETRSAAPQSGLQPPPAPSCTDSDGGQNVEIAGEVVQGNQTYRDICADPATVRENSCAVGLLVTDQLACNPGFKCSGGRCVPESAVPTVSLCGNSLCDAGENSLNCPADCPVITTAPPVEVAPPTVAPIERLNYSDIRIFATSGRLRLQINEDGSVPVYPGMVVTVYIPDAALRKPVRDAFINFNGQTYRMKPTASYEAAISIPAAIGEYLLSIIVNYQDGSSDTLSLNTQAKKGARTYERLEGQGVGVGGTRVTLLVDTGGGNFGLWNAEQYGQYNPTVTADDGTFAFIIPAGIYRLRAEKEGYRTQETLAFPAQNVISLDLQLIKLPPPPVEEIQKILATDAPVVDKTVEIAKVAATQVAYTAAVTAREVVDVVENPIVEENTRTVAAPAAVTVAVANAASAGAATATAVPYLMYVYSFLAHPTLLIARRRRKKWGVVYNALSKLPVDLAIIRLIDAKTNRISRSAVTDKDGRYFFIVPPGEYLLTVAKPGHTFPTEYLKQEKEDSGLVDIYHGEKLVFPVGATITHNIPLDPVTIEKTSRRLVLEGVGRRVQKSIGLLSIGAMLVASIITPTPLILAMFFGNIVMYAIFKRLAVGKRPKNFGTVIDFETGKPVRNAIARIFESRYNKLLETQITDDRGRYAFLVGSNVYYVTFDKPGYQKAQQGPVDLIKAAKEEEKVVAVDVKLQKASGTPIKPSIQPHQIPPVTPVQPPPAVPPTAPPVAPAATPPPPTNPQSDQKQDG